MNATDLIAQIQTHLAEHGSSLTLTRIDDIEQHMQAQYPPSYLKVMTPAEEMVGANYPATAFTDKAGKLVGLNFYDGGLNDEQLSILEALDLSDLISLTLDKNPITKFELGPNLTSLVYLTFNGNAQLKQITGGEGYDQLARLEITQTGLQRLRIPVWPKVYYLDISQNKHLTAIRFSGPCAQLQVAFLRGNALQAFTLPAGWEELVYLYLNNNQISELTLEGAYPLLRTLQLRDNELRAFPEPYLTTMPKLDALYLGRNPLPEELSGPLDEIADQNHLPKLQEYFDQRQIGDLKRNNECKVLLIGNGKAGKTAIVNRIVRRDFNPDWDSTHGISLEPFHLPDDEGGYDLNLYDFGGQDIYHHTHRLFMQQDAVYLLAWSEDTNPPAYPTTSHRITQTNGQVVVKEYKNYPLQYWLDYALHLGKNSPLHLVQTKRGEQPEGLPVPDEILATYGTSFKPKLTTHAVESAQADNFYNGYEDLLTCLKASVAHIKGKNTTIAEPLYNLRAYLRDLQTKVPVGPQGPKTISYEFYEAKAKALQVQQPREMLEAWLHKSGVVYYRRGKFKDHIILDQGWAIRAIYTLFDRSQNVPYEIEKQNGYFDGAYVQQLWLADHPDTETHELFIQYMLDCDLCFEVKTEDSNPSFAERKFMVPQLLTEEKPEMISEYWEGREASHYRFRHRYLREGVIHSVIARTAYLAELKGIWRRGIQITQGEGPAKQIAYLEASEHTIDVRLSPNASTLSIAIQDLLAELIPEVQPELIAGPATHDLTEKQAGMRGGHTRHRVGYDPEAYPLAREHMEAAIGAAMGAGIGVGKFQKEQALITSAAAIRAIVREEIKVVEQEGKRRILFLSASPIDQGRMQVDYEYQQIEEELSKGASKERFDLLKPKFAIDKSNFLKISKQNAHVIHFAGHGGTPGILIQDGQNQTKLVPNGSIKLLGQKIKDTTELVVLNCCLSAEQARILSEYVPYVVGTRVNLDDKLAVAFSFGLYNSLAEGDDIMDAIHTGVSSVVFEDETAAQDYQVWMEGKQYRIIDL